MTHRENLGALQVLLWKHYTVRKRQYFQTFLEFFMPFTLMLCLFILKNLIERKTAGGTGLGVLDEVFALNAVDPPPSIYYTPATEATEKLMTLVEDKLGNVLVFPFDKSQVLSYENINTDYVQIVKEEAMRTGKNQSALVEFEALSRVIESLWNRRPEVLYLQNMNREYLPKALHYTIHMNSIVPRRPIAKHQRQLEKFDEVPESFLRLQWAIDSSYLQLRTNSNIGITNITVEALTQRSKERKLNKVYASTIFFLLPYLCFIAPLVPFIFLMNRLLEERATGIHELVKMVGVTPEMLGIAQFLNSIPSCIIYSVGGTILLKTTDTPMVDKTNIFILFLSQFLHFASMLAMAFACSFIGSGDQNSVSLGMFVYIGLWIPVRLLGHESSSDLFLFFTGLLPHCPSYWFLSEALIAEVRYETGIQFSTINQRRKVEADGSRCGTPLMSYVMQLLQIAIFFATSWYLEKCKPGKYGIALPWNFLCTTKYWNEKKSIPPEGEPTVPYDSNYQKYFEMSPTNIQAGIEISHVSKVFGRGEDKFQALHNVTLNIYKGEITVLLGHNGAGKTTLISIITGMINPTSGKVYVNGLDTATQQVQIRKHLGFCPQHNLLFPDLTVFEHLMLFTKLKSESRAGARKAADVLMEQLKLAEHAQKRTSQLSGGMLRRLQIGCALCGNANVLILDEPTSGLDVEARRELWDMLQGLRGDRTVILTTHFMEEADVLGDRVAALHAGKLRCHATPMFLKRAVGSGFRISVTTKKEPDVSILTEKIQETLPQAKLREKSVKTVVYDLPPHINLAKLFKDIERRKSELDVESIGVGVTTLEEVFIELCGDDEPNQKEVRFDDNPDVFKVRTGCRLFFRQAKQLLKRQIDFTRSKLLTFVILQVVMPFVLCLTLTKLFNNLETNHNKMLDLNLNMYADTDLKKTFLVGDNPSRRNAQREIELAFPNYQFDGNLVRRTGTKSTLKDYLLGVNLRGPKAKIHYSPNIPHTAPVAINLMSNTLAIQRLPDANGKTIVTKISNAIPLQSEIHIPKSKVNCALFAIFNMFTIMATAINDVALPCKERISVSRYTHIMAGCAPYLYWLVTFMYHMFWYTFFCCGAVIAAAHFFDVDKTIDDQATLFVLFLTVFLCGMDFYVFAYFVSFYLNERGTSLFLIANVIGFGLLTQVMIMALDDLKETPEDPLFTRIMNIVGLVVPFHLFSKVANEVTDVSRWNSYCVHNFKMCPDLPLIFPEFDKDACCAKAESDKTPFKHLAFNKYAAGETLVLVLIQFLVFATLVLMMDYRVFNRLWNAVGKMRIRQYPAPRFHCNAVTAEKEYVDRTITKPVNEIQDVVLVKNAWKAYFSLCGKPNFALRDLCFSVKKGERFGVLGVSGAGKSTTFKVLSSEECATKGTFYANTFFMHLNPGQYLRSFGYCPQFSGLDDFRTGANNLRCLLTLRGLSDRAIRKEKGAWLDVVGMKKFCDREVSKYSGGMVRRLATAACLCGGSAVTLLDEPTAGVDTAARRLVWSALRRGSSHDRAIIISSHGMDEMEKLCNRVTILSTGEMSVLGTPRDLKENYAPGHALVFKLRVDLVDTPLGKERIVALHQRLEQAFSCSVKDRHLTSIHYRINERMEYSEIFSSLEAIVVEFQDLVEDYSVSDTTLEDVFLTFANERTNALAPEVQENRSEASVKFMESKG